MNKQISEIDKILDENNNDNIVLYDENNKKTEFEQVAVIPMGEDNIYVILKPVDKMPGVEDDEALVFHLETIDDDDCLVICDDDKIVNDVFNEYYKLLQEEGIEVGEEYLNEVKDEEK